MKAKIRKIGGRWEWECREDGAVIRGSRANWPDALAAALEQIMSSYRWNNIQELRKWKDKWSV